jgi:ferric iron reductase protein FhuF
MPAPDVDAGPALALAARTGPFFAVEQWTPGAGWRPVADLLDGSGALAERVAAGAAVLARASRSRESALDRRAVASVVTLGLLARLVSPPLAAVVLAGVLPDWSLGSLWWQPTAGGPWPLATGARTGREVGDVAEEGARHRAVSLIGSTVVEQVLLPVVRRVHEEFSLSEQVLWGNVASALGGAAAQLVAAHPARRDGCAALLDRLLDRGVLAGTTLPDRPAPRPGGSTDRRRSCCLFYRVPGGGYCADCILA